MRIATTAAFLLMLGAAGPLRAQGGDGPLRNQETAAALRGGDVVGPDIIVNDIAGIDPFDGQPDVNWYALVDGIHAYSFRTESCNIGDLVAAWISNTNDHPVISQTMYRLVGHRFEQIGQAWVKHGFATENGFNCGICQPTAGETLGVGCSDAYAANLNGAQGLLGPKSQVNPSNGFFPFPFSAPQPAPGIGRRLQVRAADLDPALNPDARFFFEAQYVAADDAAFGNAKNTVSWREVTFDPKTVVLSPLGPTVPQEPVIFAWEDHDEGVRITEITIPNDGAVGFDGWMYLGARATYLGDCRWEYEYALQNYNSFQACGVFRVPIPEGAVVHGTGFHDVDYHSGESISGADWPATVAADAVSWATEPFAVNANANAVRWGTTYNFRMVVEAPPTCDGQVEIGLFRMPANDPILVDTIAPADGFACSRTGDIDFDCDLDADDYALFLGSFAKRAGQFGYQEEANMDAIGFVAWPDYFLWLARYREFIGDPSAPPPLPQLPGHVPRHMDVTMP